MKLLKVHIAALLVVLVCGMKDKFIKVSGKLPPLPPAYNIE
jgi:hypothetical protein